MDSQANATKVQKRLINKPRKPVQVAADIVEQVLATKGDRYRETHERHLYWWQLSLVDVKLFLAALVALSVVLIAGACWLVYRLVAALAFSASAASKQHKQKAI